jgi:hypothetical protein
MTPELEYWWNRDVTPIPLLYRTKQPRVQWKKWVGVKPPKALVESWFTVFSTQSNTGIILDNGLTVLDFDRVSAYMRWRSTHLTLAKTYTVQTGRGYHVYYRAAKSLPKTLKFVDGDIKATGIVVVPPSIHANGNHYGVTRDIPIADLMQVEDLDVQIIVPAPEIEIPPRAAYTGREGIVAQLKHEISIVEYLSRYTKLEWRDQKCMIGLCPFHDDHNPSLAVYPMEDSFYCFSPNCVAHRKCDVLNAVSFIYNVSSNEAVQILKKELI